MATLDGADQLENQACEYFAALHRTGLFSPPRTHLMQCTHVHLMLCCIIGDIIDTIWNVISTSETYDQSYVKRLHVKSNCEANPVCENSSFIFTRNV